MAAALNLVCSCRPSDAQHSGASANSQVESGSPGRSQGKQRHVSMPAVRVFGSRLCRKYRPYVLIAAVILTFQAILAYSIYKISSFEDGAFREWTKDQRYVLRDGRVLAEKSWQNVKDTGAASDTVWHVVAKEPPDKADIYPFPVPQTEVVDWENSSSLEGHLADRVSKSVAKDGSSAASVLRLDELDFMPGCDIVTKEAISAINRAKTQRCKREIANLTCLIASGKVYPKRLPRFCPSNGRQTGDYLGCYRDDKSQRLLSGHVRKFSNNTPQRCIDLCLQSGFHLAGIQYGVECFCGDDFPGAKFQEDDSACDTPCSGDTSKVCGGYFKMNIYHTGITKISKTSLQSNSARNDTDARVLYLLTLNGRAVRQVRRLIRALYHVNSYFYIHVDARQEYLYRELLPLESQFPNIRLSRWRLSTIWGGASLLQMMLHCMQDVLDFSDWSWDFIINLSESDFPIKTHDELISFLNTSKGKNFLKSHGRDTQRFIVKQGLDKTFYECEARMWRTGDRELPWGIRIDGGSDWVALSREFCYYLTHAHNDMLEGLKRIYRHALLPAESFFHTVLRNSEFCDTFVDNNLHVTNWKRKVGCRCQYKHVVDWCGCSPNVFKPEDWARIRSADSRPFYFARKFEPIINQAVIDQLETWLYGPPASDLPGLTSYWQNEYHRLDEGLPSEAFLTAYHSLSRLSINLLDDLVQRCQLTIGQVLETTLYMDNDVFKGTLVLFETQIGASEVVQIETQVRPRQFFQVLKAVGPSGRLKSLQVGTLYDQKEQLFRNYGQILGPYSEPILLHKWGEGEAFAATFVWVDSANTVAGSFEVKVDAGNFINFHKPTFQQPLRPGFWTVKFMYKWELMAETKFLIWPLSYSNKTEVTQEQARSSNGGPRKTYIDHDFGNVEKLLGYRNKAALTARAQAEAQKVGPALHKWIDGLAAQFYTIQDTCYVQPSDSAKSCLALALDPCVQVPWSSRYPDPKSKIGQVDPKSGRIARYKPGATTATTAA